MTEHPITLAGRGFVCPEPLLIAAARLLAPRLAELPEPWARRHAARLAAFAPGAPGRLDLDLDALPPAARATVARVFAGLVSDISDRSRLVSADHLNRLGPVVADAPVFSAHVPVGPLQRLAAVLGALVDGSWRWTPADPEARPAHWLDAPSAP